MFTIIAIAYFTVFFGIWGLGSLTTYLLGKFFDKY